MQMDIDQLMYTAVSKDNDSNELKGFIQSQGARQSANEHLVPEMLFDDPNTTEKEAQGISAVKALQIASSQGQTIYTITKDNYNQVLPKLQLSANVMQEIHHAIHANKQVTVHERNIRYHGWYGSGYIVLDPDTGVGGYLIDGGKNGGWTDYPFLSDIVLFISTLLLANTDFFLYIDDTVKSTWYISETLKQKDKIGKISKRIGIFGVLVANFLVARNADLSLSNKIDQIIINTLSFGAISALVPLLTSGGIIGLGLLILATFAISYLAWYINNNYLTYRYNSRNRYYPLTYEKV